MMNDTQNPTSWWGKFCLQIEQCRQWRIGPLTLIIRRLDGEWQIGHTRQDDFQDEHVSWEINDTDLLPESLDDYSRFVFHDKKGVLTLTPQLADRPLISRPLTPFNLTANEEVTLYVSSPLWVEIATGTSPLKELETIAIQRPSDTWFGPSTREGELCYASSTHCRLQLNEIPQRPHRAITPVLIRNRADTTLVLERLNLPVPMLPLYAASDGQLWTPEITLVREEDGDMAELNIARRAPKEITNAVQLSKPRETTDGSALIRAFNAVFS